MLIAAKHSIVSDIICSDHIELENIFECVSDEKKKGKKLKFLIHFDG